MHPEGEGVGTGERRRGGVHGDGVGTAVGGAGVGLGMKQMGQSKHFAYSELFGSQCCISQVLKASGVHFKGSGVGEGGVGGVGTGPGVGAGAGVGPGTGEGLDPEAMAAAQRPLPKRLAKRFGDDSTVSGSQLAKYVLQQNCSQMPQR